MKRDISEYNLFIKIYITNCNIELREHFFFSPISFIISTYFFQTRIHTHPLSLEPSRNHPFRIHTDTIHSINFLFIHTIRLNIMPISRKFPPTLQSTPIYPNFPPNISLPLSRSNKHLLPLNQANASLKPQAVHFIPSPYILHRYIPAFRIVIAPDVERGNRPLPPKGEMISNGR